jgi:murein L,D-transpeptidase YafK
MRNSIIFCVFFLAAALFAGCAGGKGKIPPKPVARKTLSVKPTRHLKLTPEQQLVKGVLDKNGYRIRSPKPTTIVVRKNARKLTVYYGLTKLKTYPVVLGANPVNDKLCQGDSCTPEGIYHVVTKFEHPKWSKFILLDYPNTKNWLKFARAKKKGRIPYDSDIGGQIGIHGTEDDLKNLCGENWTWGCVSLLNNHIEEIYPLVNQKTLIIINKN